MDGMKRREFREPELVVYGAFAQLTHSVMGMSSFGDGNTHPTMNKTR